MLSGPGPSPSSGPASPHTPHDPAFLMSPSMPPGPHLSAPAHQVPSAENAFPPTSPPGKIPLGRCDSADRQLRGPTSAPQTCSVPLRLWPCRTHRRLLGTLGVLERSRGHGSVGWFLEGGEPLSGASPALTLCASLSSFKAVEGVNRGAWGWGRRSHPGQGSGESWASCERSLPRPQSLCMQAPTEPRVRYCLERLSLLLPGPPRQPAEEHLWGTVCYPLCPH